MPGDRLLVSYAPSCSSPRGSPSSTEEVAGAGGEKGYKEIYFPTREP